MSLVSCWDFAMSCFARRTRLRTLSGRVKLKDSVESRHVVAVKLHTRQAANSTVASPVAFGVRVKCDTDKAFLAHETTRGNPSNEASFSRLVTVLGIQQGSEDSKGPMGNSLSESKTIPIRVLDHAVQVHGPGL